MKWLAAGLTFVNAATVSALLFGILDGGLGRGIAAISFLGALILAVLAYLQTNSAREHPVGAGLNSNSPELRLGRIFFWILAACFGYFAFRSFGWLLFIDSNSLKVQSVNNLGDLSLHIAYVKTFANGVPLWPDNPIHAFSKMRYPGGTDLFNALSLLLGLDLTRGFIWAGAIGSLATFYALYKWGGSFAVAAFLFNGGTAGFQFLQRWKFLDYQGDKTIAWKSLPLAMFVTQRGLLYALPVGLLLLYQWRAKYVARPDGNNSNRSVELPPLPFWVELTLYATMPLFHLHTFMALSFVAPFLFLIGDRATRKQLGLLAGASLIPATYLVWTITDHFRAQSTLRWWPGWVLHDKTNNDFARPFFQFWFVNFGLWPFVVLALIGMCIWHATKSKPLNFREQPALAFVASATALFLFACLVKTAPWEWDNIKLIVWAYLIILPFLWSDLIVRWSIPVRTAVCGVLFASGFVSLFGGLAAGQNGYALAERPEVDGVGAAVLDLPASARFAAFPTYNHPLLLQGRKVVLGYPGHLWTQGFDYAEMEKRLNNLMNGAPHWREEARYLGARYLFWGREEKAHYAASTRPWEREVSLVKTGNWGAIYDLESGPVIPQRQ